MSSHIIVVGLGPAGLDRLPPATLDRLRDPAATVILRTGEHPAATELEAMRRVVSCDDLYEAAPDFEALYEAIVARVLDHGDAGTVVYAVPGSAVVGERSARMLVKAGQAAGHEVLVLAGESFLDLVFARVALDPIADGVQIVDGRALPDPLPLHLPTVITQVDRPVVLADVAATLGKVLPDDTEVVFLDRLGGVDEVVERSTLTAVVDLTPGPRTTLFVDPPPVGWHGLVVTNRVLRNECPWDREQTHHTLVSHLIEEAYEAVEAISRLSPEAPAGAPDFGAYAELEEELGDLLLQVVFHATLAAEVAAFDVEEIAEGIRRKLVDRHPHVFGDVDAATAREVKQNWERLKADEKARESLMDDVPVALPAVARADKIQRRAASIGFDWQEAGEVLGALQAEVAELAMAVDANRDAEQPGSKAAVSDEFGDVLFSAVNLARHLDIDPEMALRVAADKFADRFRKVETMAGSAQQLAGLSASEMERLWRRAKAADNT
jgi:tetrapyrrole methylase family protein/MazG family protein